jgi:hypothetical protein
MPGFADLLHHHIARTGLDDLFSLGNVMADAEDEPARMGSYLLVLSEGELDQLGTAQLGALAAKPARCIFLPGPPPACDALVDLAESCLVRRDPLFVLAFDPEILPRFSISRSDPRIRQCSGRVLTIGGRRPIHRRERNNGRDIKNAAHLLRKTDHRTG